MDRTERLSLLVLPAHKRAVEAMARAEGESMAAIVRRLIHAEAQRRGLWFPLTGQAPAGEAALSDEEMGLD